MGIARYIPSIASAVKKIKGSDKKPLQTQSVNTQSHYSELKKKAREIWRKEIEAFGRSLQPHPEWVQSGDLAILDIYHLKGVIPRHNWDGGPGAIQSCVNKRDILNPIWCRIENVGLDYSLAEELFDRYLDASDPREIEFAVEQKSLLNLYRAWLQLNFRRGQNDPDMKHLGLYFSCFFDTNISFKPSWRLSIEYFLKAGTELAMATEEAWNEEIEIDLEQEALAIRKQELQKRKAGFASKFAKR